MDILIGVSHVMKIRNTQDLQNYLDGQKLSPEAFSKKCMISNMTIRRYLSKGGDSAIPMKYWAAFDRVTDTSNHSSAWFGQAMDEDFSAFADSLEKDGKGEHDLGKMDEELKTKKKSPHVGQKLKEAVTSVFNAVIDDRLQTKDRFLAIGALLYFLNPIDLIPDTTPAVGYLDDYAVLTMVVARLAVHVRPTDRATDPTSELV